MNSPSPNMKHNLRDAEFMLRVIGNMEGKPKVNWDKVAQDMNLKSGTVAAVRFGQIKKKLGFTAPSQNTPGSGAATTSPTKATKSPEKVRDPASKVTKNTAGRKPGRPKKESNASAIFETGIASASNGVGFNIHEDSDEVKGNGVHVKTEGDENADSDGDIFS